MATVALINDKGEPQDEENIYTCIKICKTMPDEHEPNKVEKYTYAVKAGIGRTLYNPVGFDSEGTITKNKLGQKRWRFVNVSREVCEFYRRFLETRNVLWLRHAQRGMIQ
jgi:hypothetical protein